ncbi:MAG TPA: NAD(P)H-dependent glycerol-3-phosphate dehydrogenase [Dongiaceae bacterium]|jgi:glycerol-3-phosphate dehydrogenase (NAD(P)+)|nr:NAD(P)H-dependent glycerol-3-phosphate dehydrogenase [Dongiaceae bacterium]
MTRLSVIGAGAWGTALAVLAARAGCAATLWARRPAHAAELAAARENAAYLPGIAVDPAIRIESDFARALDADAVIYAQPAQHFRAFCRAAAAHWCAGAALVIAAKGIECGTGALLNEIAAETLPAVSVAILSGPSFAAEAARGLPTAVAIAGSDAGLVDRMMTALAHGAFRPYGADDPVGVEVAGAVKNVLAIACGIVVGRGLGENARAALITRGLAEVTRLALAKGGRAETLMGLAGIGDLVLTCTSLKSRNTSLGFELGQGKRLADILSTRRSIAEGVTTAEAVVALAQAIGVELPIAAAVNRILTDQSVIDDEVRGLLARPLKRET